MCSSCKSCKVFAAGLGWSCHDPWVNMSDVTDVMKNSTTCHVTTMGFSIGKRQVSPLRQVLTLWWWTSQVVFFVWQFRPGAHLSACVVFLNQLNWGDYNPENFQIGLETGVWGAALPQLMAEECEEEVESETPALTLRQLTGLARSLEYPELIQLIVALVGELQARVVLQAAAEAERQEELNRTPWRRARRRAEAKGSGKGRKGRGRPYWDWGWDLRCFLESWPWTCWWLAGPTRCWAAWWKKNLMPSGSWRHCILLWEEKSWRGRDVCCGSTHDGKHMRVGE